MKLIALTVVGIGVIGGILLNVPYTATHTQESTEVEITALPEVVEVDVIEKRIADAQAKAMDSINEKADAMRGEFVANELKKIEAEVLAEIEKEIKTRRVDVEKQTGAYWRNLENVKALIRATFPEAPHTAVEVARLETNFRMVQSKEKYTRDRPEYGLKAGDREQSYCIFQIHEPAHIHTIRKHGLEDYRTNIESCVKMARIVYDERGNFTAWSVYNNLIAMR